MVVEMEGATAVGMTMPKQRRASGDNTYLGILLSITTDQLWISGFGCSGYC